MDVKEDLREAETWPDGDGAAREDEGLGMQGCREGSIVVCAYVHTHECTHVNLAPCLRSANLIHSLKELIQ